MFLPIAISADGAFLTHSQTITRVPTQERVHQFLPPYNRGDLLLHPDNPITVAPQVNEDWVIEIRRQNDEATKRAYGVIEEAYADFRRDFGRGPENPWFEEYMTEDADIILMGMGTLSLPVKVAIRNLRKQGKKVGLIRLRWFRPFPYEQLARALGHAKAIGVIDRDYSFGSPFGSGVVANEVRAALYNAEHRPPLIGFICGLGGREVTLEDVNKAVDICYAAAKQGPRGAGDLLAGRARVGERETMADATTFTNDTQVLLPFKGVKKVTIEEYFTSGHRTCQGCESALVMKLMVKASGPRTIVLGLHRAACTSRTRRTTPPRGWCRGCTRSSARRGRRRSAPRPGSRR